MNEFQDLEKLLRLKRYEKPPDGYFEDFYEQFRSRQRSEMLRQSARGLLIERLSTWLWQIGNRKVLLAGGAAYAAIMIGIFLNPFSDRYAAEENERSAVAPVPAKLNPAEDAKESADLLDRKPVDLPTE